MTNEEEAREIANNSSTKIVGAEVSDETYITTESDCYTAAITMAKWKDEQFKAEKEALINKACEWLRNNSYMLDDWDEDKCWVTFEFTSKDEMIKDFHKTMKGGEE